MPKRSQLVLDPPLPTGVDEADLLQALDTFPEFKLLFLYKHFYLMTFDTMEGARDALEHLNNKLPASVDIRWDYWQHGDPETGPYPDVSSAVESNFVFIPRTFVRASAICKMVEHLPGFRGGRAVTRGHIVQFRTVRHAYGCIDYLTSKTDMLVFFVDKEGNPIEPIAEEDSYGDFKAAKEGANAPDRTSLHQNLVISPYGGDISVLINLLASFYGWKKALFDGSINCTATFSDPAMARRAFRYFTTQTPALVFLEAGGTQQDGPTYVRKSTKGIHIALDKKIRLPKKRKTAQRRLETWLEGYKGFIHIAFFSEDCIIAVFVRPMDAEAALKHLNESTNLLTTFYRTGELCPSNCQFNPVPEKQVSPSTPVGSPIKEMKEALKTSAPPPLTTSIAKELAKEPCTSPPRTEPAAEERVKAPLRAFLSLKGVSASTSKQDLRDVFSAFRGFLEVTKDPDQVIVTFRTEDNADQVKEAISAYCRLGSVKVDIPNMSGFKNEAKSAVLSIQERAARTRAKLRELEAQSATMQRFLAGGPEGNVSF
ncbi:uncharacterized protein SPPG_02968 [Spizellomyces punctatus DAOM BR117]|uniref:RRM domain-containing protein n=1 Tax=Spizellomyces punctatus (strain DAOM BR117) TaxID=645134 RepID=A0A0L0HNI4_SPIPD|nr:uncharacterized protein SPPG_02968 [Spizellomyces punctatus DAOM BR117]KND02510.1 hypothetical protein SPPG_02968 [Spizellomyces punctatus DAOM BR117]|eukprot:XP_016610549.1 hypothetical protein SPPG_02968 [Spizellomyces punctatus DAOM BR117]